MHQDTLLILDISDLSKQYARRMEYLTHVRDGNTGGAGAWVLDVCGDRMRDRFAAVYVGNSLKLTIFTSKVLTVAKRFFGIPPFHSYALADGIAAILAHATVGPLRAHTKPQIASPQRQLFDG